MHTANTHSSVLFPVSGNDSRSVASQAAAWRQWLANNPGRVVDAAYSAGALASHGPVRRATTVTSDVDADRWLAGIGQAPPAGRSGEPGPVALVFSGQGNQWLGMGNGLLESAARARQVLIESDAVIRAVAGWSLLDELASASAMEDPAVLQPTLVALQVAVAAQLARWGVVVDAYVGHSLGEVSAAVAAGVLDLADGLRLAIVRGEVMRDAVGTGLTALLGVRPEEVEGVDIAAWNGPHSTLVSGDSHAVTDLVAGYAGGDVFARILPGTTAFHSRAMRPSAEKLVRLVGGLTPRPADGVFVSTVTGAVLAGTALDARYWGDNVRRPVRFAQAVETLADLGFRTFVEVGAHPTLEPSIKDCADVEVVPTLRRGEPGFDALLTTVGRLFELGANPDWSALYPDERRPVRPPRVPVTTVPASWLDRTTPVVPLKFRQHATSAGAPADQIDRQLLLAAEPSERAKMITEYLSHQVAAVLQMPAAQVAGDRPLTSLGLDSIMGMELCRRARAALGVEISAARLLGGLTVRQLADELAGLVTAPSTPTTALPAVDLDDPAEIERLMATIDELSAEEVDSLLARLSPGRETNMGTADLITEPAGDAREALRLLLVARRATLDDTYPVSAGQRALWLFDQLNPGSPAYNLSFAARVTGALDVQAMRATLQHLVDLHPALRTTLHETDGGLRQRVRATATVQFADEDLRGGSPAEIEEAVARHARRPFDLGTDTVLRGAVLRLAPAENLLVISSHHIATDLWSFGLLMRDLADAYPALAAGQVLPPATTGASYVDFVRWQRDLVAGPSADRATRYWADKLDGDVPRLDLPTDRPRPAHPTHFAGVRTLRIGERVTAALKALARQENATLYAATIAAFGLVLHRHTGQRDIWVGSVRSGRGQDQFREVVGYFVNPTVVRTRIGDRQTFRDLLGEVRDTVLDSLEHEDYPFPLAVHQLAGRRGTAPVFDVACYYESSPWTAHRGLSLFGTGFTGVEVPLGDLVLRPYELPMQSTEHDLALFVEEVDGTLCCSLRYATDLFDEATVGGLLERFAILVESCVTHSDTPHRELEIMSTAERRQVLRAWSRTDDGIATDTTCVHDLVLAQAVRTPDAVAVEGDRTSLTYRELVERAEDLAKVLRARGVGPEVMVGLSVDGSSDLVIGLLAVLLAGGAYVPLDPTYPVKRLEYMMADSAIVVLLTHRHLLDRLPATDVPVLLLDEEIQIPTDAPPAVAPRADNLAYVIYTSGSTGRPKGVMVEHRGLVDLDLAHRDAFEPVAGRRILQNSSISFDVSTWEWLMALTTGSTLCLAPRESLRPGPGLIETIRSRRITGVCMTPSVMATMNPADLSCVTELTSVGEAISAELVSEWAVGRRIVNAYGPTEITVFGTYEHCLPDGSTPPIGRAFAATELYVLDESLRPVPVGVVGELYLGGTGVTRGYQNRPGLTADRYTPHPFATTPGERVYRTGDRVRFGRDGRLHYLGRSDHQIKIRGVRTEPGEVQAVLVGHPSVREAVVLARPARNGELQLVGYAVPHETVTSAELRAYMAERLMPNMVPAFLVVMDEFELNPNGKVDRGLLPDPELSRPDTGDVERTPVQAALAAIWCEVLGVAGAGAEDDFFELGGHSLAATRVIARVHETLGVKLPLREVFERRTIPALAEAVEAHTVVGGDRIVPQPRDDNGLPLSYAQQRLWFVEQLRPGDRAYRIAGELHFDGDVDVPRLRAAMADVVRRHEALRTVYRTVDGEPRQIVGPVPADPLPVDPLGFDEPFDLSQSPLRACLVPSSDGGQVVRLALHHIAGDGWSMRIIVRDLASFYRTGEPTSPPPVQYPDFAAWQRSRMDGQESLRYWETRLAGCPDALDLPTDRPRRELSVRPAGNVSGTLAFDEVRKFATRTGSTPATVLLAAYGVLLSRWSGQRDVLVGMPVAGRVRQDVEDTVGLFVNTVVVRMAVSGTFLELVEDVLKSTVDAQVHQEVPFERIVDRLALRRDLTRTPLFQVLFNMLTLDEFTPDFAGLPATLTETADVSARFDVTLYLQPAGDRVDLKLVYDKDLYDQRTAEHLLAQFTDLVDHLVSTPDVAVDEHAGAADLSPLSRAAWTRAAHERFFDQAEKSPERCAIRHADRELSYGQLADAASQVGAGQGDLVVLDGERGPDLVVGILATLWAGATFAILDRTLPPARRDQLTAAISPVTSLGRPGPSVVVAATDPAYVAFTSGTTGVPKAVKGLHGPLAHFLDWYVGTFGITADDRFALTSGLGHDPLLRDIFAPLSLGAVLCIPSTDDLKQPDAYVTWLAANEVTVLHLTPPTARFLAGGPAGALPHLRYAFFGGDVLTGREVAIIRRLAPQARIVNFYGATETPQAHAWYEVPGDIDERQQVPVGSGIDGAHLLVLRDEKPAAVGELGEIVVRSRHLADGYLDSSNCFQPDPEPGVRRYRTGDLGRLRADGTIMFAGRGDRQVKVRGHRLDLSEVQRVLQAHEAVTEAVVTSTADESGEVSVEAYAVAGADPAELRAHLRDRLASYAVPAKVSVVAEIPLTGNGKVDLGALGRLVTKTPGRAPARSTEAAISAVWQRLLRVEQVGRDDNFFDLGGHSLLMVRMRDVLSTELGKDIAVVDLFRYPTVSALAGALEKTATAPNPAVEDRTRLVADRRRRLKEGRRDGR